uniref:Uncharacterized protein n=1 Tax=Strigamia maritima TaxID=126957 RepID=T1JMD7_STRMM
MLLLVERETDPTPSILFRSYGEFWEFQQKLCLTYSHIYFFFHRTISSLTPPSHIYYFLSVVSKSLTNGSVIYCSAGESYSSPGTTLMNLVWAWNNRWRGSADGREPESVLIVGSRSQLSKTTFGPTYTFHS